MKTTICLALSFALGACTVDAGAADWNAPQDPFAVYGNTYYVGTGGISAVLISTYPPAISSSMADRRRLQPNRRACPQARLQGRGHPLHPEGHEHFDHAGGIAALQKLSGATVLASPVSAEVLRRGQPDKRDAQYPGLQARRRWRIRGRCATAR